MEHVINQTYTAPPHPLYLSLLSHIIYLLIIIIIITVFIIRRFNTHRWRYQPPSIPLTVTEIIYTRLNPILPDNLIKLILIEYCGYRNIPCLEHVVTLKRKFKQTQRIRCGKIALVYVAMCILIASLVFAAYSGIIFLFQNDQYLKKYSIRIQLNCGFDENICIVNNDGNRAICQRSGGAVCDYSDKAICQYSICSDFHKYQNFYNNTFIPYLQTLNDPDLMEYFQNNPALYVSLKTQKFDDYSGNSEDHPVWQYNNYGSNTVDAYLHLNENVFSDSDFSLAKPKEYPSRGCYRCYCWNKGGGQTCAGCDCYCEGDITQSTDNGAESANDCCCCCICNICVPCHCVCTSCCLCCTGVAISMLLMLILFFVYYWIVSAVLVESELISILEEIVKEIHSIDNEWNV